MLKVENVDGWGFKHAIRGMRNPMNSWEKSDSKTEYPNPQYGPDSGVFMVGENDLNLMRELFKAGTEHRKYLRQIMVSMDITAPLYWWKQFDRYQIGVTTNSCSTMYKIMEKPFEINDFSFEKTQVYNEYLVMILGTLNHHRDCYINYDKYKAENTLRERISKQDIFYSLIQLLPSSYNQKRTVTMNYENVFTIIRQRQGHKLDEWRELVNTLLRLPYVKEIGGI